MRTGDDPTTPHERRAARAAGARRVQSVTLWAAAGSVTAAAVLSVALAQGAGATTTTPATTTPTATQNQGDTTAGTGQDQLQSPDYLPGASTGGSRHGSSGGS